MLNPKEDGPTIKNAIRKRIPNILGIHVQRFSDACGIAILVNVTSVPHFLTVRLPKEFYHIDLLNAIDQWSERIKQIDNIQKRGEMVYTPEEYKANAELAANISPAGVF